MIGDDAIGDVFHDGWSAGRARDLPVAAIDALQQAGCERLFQDVMSSPRLDRPGLQEALSHLRQGDTLLIIP